MLKHYNPFDIASLYKSYITKTKKIHNITKREKKSSCRSWLKLLEMLNSCYKGIIRSFDFTARFFTFNVGFHPNQRSINNEVCILNNLHIVTFLTRRQLLLTCARQFLL